MKLVRLWLLAGVLVAQLSCSKSRQATASAASQESLARAATVRILGADLPAGATEVVHFSAMAFTHLEDVQFECSEEEWKRFWVASPKLSEALPVERLPPLSDLSVEVLDTSWLASGGTQFCRVDARREPSGSVAVVIKTTHEMDR